MGSRQRQITRNNSFLLLTEFLKHNYHLLIRSVEILAAIIGLFCLKKYKNSTSRYFIYILIYWVAVEIIGNYTLFVEDYEFLHGIRDRLQQTLFRKNHWWFSIFGDLFAGLFFSFYFIKIMENRLFKRIIKHTAILYGAVFVLYYMLNFKSLFTDFTYIGLSLFWSFLIMMCCVFYFVEVLQSDRILNFYKSLDFYIAAVLFVWLLIITPVSFYNVYYKAVDWNFIFLKWQIYLGAIMFMYLTFSFALLWCKPQND